MVVVELTGYLPGSLFYPHLDQRYILYELTVNGGECWELQLGEQFGDQWEEYNRLRHRN